MEQRQNNNKGITIISLVVTIVLLLIISGITIGVFTGKSAMVDNATDAQIMTQLSQLKVKLDEKRAEGEGKRLIKSGNYSGKMTNHDLASEEIIKEFEVNITDGDDSKENAIVGIVIVENVAPEENLGKNHIIYDNKEPSYTDNSITIGTQYKDLTTDFTDVFALDVKDDTLYYVRDGKLWKLPGNNINLGDTNTDEPDPGPDEPGPGPDEPNNTITFSYKIGEIDATTDEINKINEKVWFNKEIIVNVTWGKDLQNDKSLTSSAISTEDYKIDKTNSITVKSGEQTITATATGTGTEGKVTKEVTLKVDTKQPKIIIGKNTGDKILKDGIATVKTKVTITDDISGLDNANTKYGWSNIANTEPTSWNDVQNEETDISYEVREEDSYYLWIKAKDNAGNEIVERKEFKVSEAVAEVEISGTRTPYATLQEAIDSCPKDGTKATIYLLKDIEETTSTYTGQDIILDLRGYTINNNTQDKPTIENNATLNIIDSLEDENKVGKIISTNTIAIQNNENATLTLGTNDDIVSTTNPEIIGKVNGILSSGTFNFYDGIIRANKAISGTITNTPTDYSAITTLDGESEIATLGILADYAAKIENVYFSTLPEAVEAAKDNDTIELLTPSILTETLAIGEDKNITIDLAGNNIQLSSTSDYLIKNYGKLKLISNVGQEEKMLKGIKCEANGIVDTGIKLTGNYRIEAQVEMNKYENTYNNIYGTKSASFESYSAQNTNTLMFVQNGTSRKIESTNVLSTGKVYNIVEEYKDTTTTMTVNGSVWASGTSTNGNSGIVKLFATTSDTCTSNITMYSFKIYIEDILKLDLVPVRKGETVNGNTAQYNGFYDNVSNTFKYSKGTEFGFVEENKTIETTGTRALIEGGTSVESVIYNDTNANLNINNVTISLENAGTSSKRKNLIYNLGNINLENNAYIQSTKSYTDGVYNLGILTNNGAIIDTKGNSVYNDGNFENINGRLKTELLNNSGEVKITGGVINNINNKSNKELVVQGGIITSGIKNNATEGKIKVTNGTIYQIYNQSGENFSLNILGGNIKNTTGSSPSSITNYAGGTCNINISEGNIESISISGNSKETNINMTEGTVKNLSFSAKSGNIVIESGTITSGITLNNENATITLGKDDENINENTPQIIGGITTKGSILNFYDGKIVSSSTTNPAVIGEITKIPENAELNYGLENNKQVITLKQMEGPIAKIVKDTQEQTYYKIQDAINAYESEESGIVFLRDFSTLETITIEENKNIMFDLNGKNILSTKNEFITNNGHLTIKDINTSGTIKCNGGTIIVNNGDLTINSGIICSELVGTNALHTIGILNKANLNINGGTIKGTKDFTDSVKNESTGIITFTGGEVQVGTVSNSIGVNNEGTLQFNGGNIKSVSTSKTNYGTGIKNSGEINITNGILEKLATGISNVNGELNFNNGNISATTGISETSNTLGTINIIDGNIETTSCAIYLNGKSNININGGKIKSPKAIETTTQTDIEITGGIIECTGTAVILKGKTTFKMSGGSISSNTSSTVYGIQLFYNGSTSNNPTIEIAGGTISAITSSTSTSHKAYGIYMYKYKAGSNTTKVTIGTKGDGVSITKPNIFGTTYGIYNECGQELNFYDGIIKGKTSIEGNVTEWEQDYDIIKTTQNEIESAYLASDMDVAKIGEQGFKTLDEALESCKANTETTIVLLRSVTIEQEKEILENQNIILDLQGNTITFTSEKGFTNNGKFKIIDTVGEGILKTTAGTIIENNDELIINSGTISIEKEGSSAAKVNGIINNSNLTIQGGTIQTTKQNVNIILNNVNSILLITNGTIISTISTDSYKPTVGVCNNGEINMQGGNINNTYIGIDNLQDGKVTLNGGTINLKSSNDLKSGIGVQNNNGEIYVKENTIIDVYTGLQDISTEKGIINIESGTIDAVKGINLSKNAEVNISGGTIQATNTGIYSTSDSGSYSNTINITGGYINVTGRGIYLERNVNLKMTSGNIIVKDSSICYGIFITNSSSNYTQNILIKDGNINASTTNTNYKAYGIYMDTLANLNLTLGEQDGNANITNPSIYGTTYGIYNIRNNSLNIYDGVVSGNKAIEGKISDVEPQYGIYTESSDGIEKAYLSNEIPVAEVNGKNYMTLKEAFDEVQDNTRTTIKILRDFTVSESESSITIGENKNIVIDLNGKKVNLDNENSVINNGILEICDTSTNGIIKTHAGNIIVNNNELKINSGTISVEVEGNGTKTVINGIVNNSNLEVNGGIIKTTCESVNIIKNEVTGKVIMQNGTIKSTASISEKNPVKGIESLGEVELNGGNISNTYIGINNLETGKVTLNGGTIDIKNSNGSKSGNGVQNNNGEIYIKENTIIDASTGIYDISLTQGTINVEGGEIDAVTAINLTKTANVNITGGAINSTSCGISISGNGSNVTMAEGTINSSGTNAVYIASSSTFKMTGGSINVNCDNTYGINVYTSSKDYVQNIEITGGTIIATTTNSNGKAYGIYMHTYNKEDYKQTLTIGTQDKSINLTKPDIAGDTYGVYNESGAIFNFYDGILKGKTLAMSGNITRVENKYTIVGGTLDEYQTATLGLLATDTVTAFVNGTYYNSLQAAISSCADNEKTYVIMSNGTVLDSDITIGENQNIVLDLNGYTISGSASIINNGTLTITDNSEEKTGSITVNVSGSGTVSREI